LKLRLIPRAAALAAALILFGLLPLATTLSAQQPAEQLQGRVVIGAVEIAGASRIPEPQVRAEVGVEPGDTIDYLVIQRAMHRLWGMGQFADIRIFLVGDPAALTPVTLRVEIEEQPVVAAIEFRGLENVRPSVVRDTVGLEAGQPYRPGAAARAEAMVRALLASQGIQLASIAHRLEDLPDRPLEKRLVFDVREGGRVAIADVEFEGNTRFSDDELGSALATRPEGFLWFRQGRLDDVTLRQDLRANLPAFYGQRGYLDFAVVGDSLVVDEETGKARLVIRVDEGPQYRLAEFDIRGNREFASEDLRAYFEAGRSRGLLGLVGLGRSSVAADSVFDVVAFQEATQAVAQLYNNSGFLYAQVEPVIERIPPTDSTPAQVRVAWDINEYQPAYIRQVAIEGNTHTHDDVIRNQILVLPGDVYSEELLIQSYRRISALGFFETPMPTPRIEPDEATGDVDITFEVAEKQTGSLNFGTALGGASGIAGFIGYDEPNLFGRAKSGHLRWEFGSYSNNFEASYSDPSILESNISGSLSVFSSRDRFITFREGRRRRTGSAIRFGLPLPTDPRYSRLIVGYSLSRTSYEQFDEDDQGSLFSQPPGIQSTVTLGLQRATIDHPLFPTVGTRLDLSADLNGGVLGGDGNFQRYIASGSVWVPMGSVGGDAPGGRPVRFTLGLSAEAGAITGDVNRFPFEKFYMGGVQFGRNLRGYDETEITPFGVIDNDNRTFSTSDRLGNAFLRLSAEYAIRLNDNISVQAFYDAGGVFFEPQEINPLKLARGAGVGLMLVTPFGPIGLDYAYGFDKPQPGWQLHFKFGQGF
jgi:outer membrane protein insertion porin family